MSLSDKAHFKMMSLVHETLYGLFRDPYEALNAAGLEPGQEVLEVGCGPGFFTAPAARIVGEKGNVCALDINPLAVKRAQQKIKAEVQLLLAKQMWVPTHVVTQTFWKHLDINVNRRVL